MIVSKVLISALYPHQVSTIMNKVDMLTLRPRHLAMTVDKVRRLASYLHQVTLTVDNVHILTLHVGHVFMIVDKLEKLGLPPHKDTVTVSKVDILCFCKGVSTTKLCMGLQTVSTPLIHLPNQGPLGAKAHAVRWLQDMALPMACLF